MGRRPQRSPSLPSLDALSPSPIPSQVCLWPLGLCRDSAPAPRVHRHCPPRAKGDLELVSCSVDTQASANPTAQPQLSKNGSDVNFCLAYGICLNAEYKKKKGGAAPAYRKSVFDHGTASAYQVTVRNCRCYGVPACLCRQRHNPRVASPFPVIPVTRGAESGRAVLCSLRGPRTAAEHGPVAAGWAMEPCPLLPPPFTPHGP